MKYDLIGQLETAHQHIEEMKKMVRNLEMNSIKSRNSGKILSDYIIISSMYVILFFGF